MSHGLVACDQPASLDVGADMYAMHHKHDCIDCPMTVMLWPYVAHPSGLQTGSVCCSILRRFSNALSILSVSPVRTAQYCIHHSVALQALLVIW